MTLKRKSCSWLNAITLVGKKSSLFEIELKLHSRIAFYIHNAHDFVVVTMIRKTIGCELDVNKLLKS